MRLRLPQTATFSAFGKRRYVRRRVSSQAFVVHSWVLGQVVSKRRTRRGQRGLLEAFR